MIGLVIRRIRESEKKHLRDVADHCGISVPDVSSFELGRISINKEIFIEMCNYLNIEQKVIDAFVYVTYNYPTSPISIEEEQDGQD